MSKKVTQSEFKRKYILGVIIALSIISIISIILIYL